MERFHIQEHCEEFSIAQSSVYGAEQVFTVLQAWVSSAIEIFVKAVNTAFVEES